jgi:hypothetical protein
MVALPKPLRGGEIAPYLGLMHLDPHDLELTSAYMSSCFDPSVNKPLFTPWGKTGSGKSTVTDLVADCLDPVTVPRQSFQAGTKDWVAGLETGAVVVFDNFTGASRARLSDLCQSVTGGSDVGRRLYENSTPHGVNLRRIVLLSTTGVKGLPDDVLSRMLRVDVTPLRDRLAESDIKRRADEARASALGWLLDHVVDVLNEWPSTPTPRVRMADFGRWVAAGDAVRGGSALVRYEASTRRAMSSGLFGDPLLSSLPDFLRAEGGVWIGTAARLIVDLRQAGFPLLGCSPVGVGKRLRSQAASLQAAGIDVEMSRSADVGRTRFVCLWQTH